MKDAEQLTAKKMSKEKKNAAAIPLVRELFQWGLYKRSQGRITRQITFAAIAGLFVIGAWRLSGYMSSYVQPGAGGEGAALGIPLAVALVGVWLAYRLVNLPSFADFLIAVEAEMNKVSWPTRTELVRSSLVVIFSIIFLAVILYGYDTFWSFLLSRLGVMRRM